MKAHQILSLENVGAFAAELALELRPGLPILLSGEVGVGKSTLARFVVWEFMGQVLTVPSPTFPLMIPYDGIKGRLWHMDLYRLKDTPSRLHELNMPECLKNDFCLIEWPCFLGSLCPAAYIAITLEPTENAKKRKVHCQGVGL
jgi:tRNA threonylcarbamoyl adenosine modification protein YjeE